MRHFIDIMHTRVSKATELFIFPDRVMEMLLLAISKGGKGKLCSCNGHSSH
jgi:hypothetical protein